MSVFTDHLVQPLGVVNTFFLFSNLLHLQAMRMPDPMCEKPNYLFININRVALVEEVLGCTCGF